MKCEFSKKLLVVDYLVLIVLFVCAIYFTEVDFTTIIVAWIAQLGISSAAYYWKAKNENRAKVPLKVVESLPEDIRQQLDLTQVVTSIIQSD
jgi:hypothetical protein